MAPFGAAHTTLMGCAVCPSFEVGRVSGSSLAMAFPESGGCTPTGNRKRGDPEALSEWEACQGVRAGRVVIVGLLARKACYERLSSSWKCDFLGSSSIVVRRSRRQFKGQRQSKTPLPHSVSPIPSGSSIAHLRPAAQICQPQALIALLKLITREIKAMVVPRRYLGGLHSHK